MIRIPAETAYNHSGGNAEAKWPSRDKIKRFEPVCMPAIRNSFSLVKGEKIFTIGSCFARHIEMALSDNGFEVPAFRFEVPKSEIRAHTQMVSGILNKFTPHSMLNEVLFAFSDSDGSEYLIETEKGLYLDEQLHTNIPVTLERGLERRVELRTLYKESIRTSRIIVITLGLVETWWDAQNEVYLNNTPSLGTLKRHPGRFFFEVLSSEDTIATVEKLILELKKHGHPEQRIMLTVSPVPLSRTFTAKDIIVANSYSKSVLRVAAETIVGRYDWVDYYPSFESVMYSDRTIAWEDDLVHVRMRVVKENVNRMIKVYSPPPAAVSIPTEAE